MPGLEVAVFEKWIVVSSQQNMWGSKGDLDRRIGNNFKPVIVVINIESATFLNTGLIGSRPAISRTPDKAVTIAFEVDEECLTPPGVPPPTPPDPPSVSGYPNLMPSTPGGLQTGCSSDANGDSDTIDRVIVLYTLEPGPSGCPQAGFIRIFAPPGQAPTEPIRDLSHFSGAPRN